MELQRSLLASKQPSVESEQEREEQDHQRVYKQCRDIVSRLPTVDGCWVHDLHFHDGWFSHTEPMVNAMAIRKLFQARPTDIIMASTPKSGTTWLKALLFSIVNRESVATSDRSLNTHSPHDCVPFLEIQLYRNDGVPDWDSYFGNSSVRLLATHIPFHFLPDSVAESGCRVVYLCRNPKDTFMSMWHFITRIGQGGGVEVPSFEAAFDHFCEGRSHYGPFWNHMLGYWNASIRTGANKVMFMKYEELMEDPVQEVKRLALFVGHPFSQKEEEEGVVEDIVELCRFDKLSNLEVNKVGKTRLLRADFANSNFFRRGVVGDWKNHLTPDMVLRLDAITEKKLEGSGLSF